MKYLLTITTAVTLAMGVPTVSLAKNDKSGPPAHAQNAKDCPPGLAKKTPACVPPGLAKDKTHDDDGEVLIYRIGDRLPRDYDRLRDPYVYELPLLLDGSEYYMVDNKVYRVSPETREVLEVFDAIKAVFN